MHDLFSFGILGLVEGVTEFLPVSSSGHLILARELLGVEANGLAVDAVLQLATVLAVVVYFFKDLLSLFYTALNIVTGRTVKPEDRKLLVALIVGTIPAVILGLLLEKTMDTVFRNSHLVAYALFAGSLLFILAEYLSKKIGKNLSADSLGAGKGFIIGLFQSIALIPGMSRSGMTISGGLILGLSREAAARFGFLLAVPVTLGAGAKKFLDLYSAGGLTDIGVPLLWGSAIAFISGLLAIQALMMFVRKQPLYVFVVYRVLLAGVILLYF